MASMTWAEILEEIRHDYRAGATALTERAACALVLLAGELTASDSDGEIGVRLRQLAAVRPPFGSLFRVANEAAVALTSSKLMIDRSDVLLAVAEQLRARLRAEYSKVVTTATDLVLPGARVLTLSASLVVRDTLVHAQAIAGNLGVTCLESRPGAEGRQLADQLVQSGLAVRLAPDAAVGRLVHEIDLILVGGDTVTSGGLIHKLGTFGLALAAQACQVPIYSLSGGLKFLPAAVSGWESDGDPSSETSSRQIGNIGVWNRSFDLTPLELLSGVVSERGLAPPGEAAKLAAEQRVHPWLADLLGLQA